MYEHVLFADLSLTINAPLQLLKSLDWSCVLILKYLKLPQVHHCFSLMDQAYYLCRSTRLNPQWKDIIWKLKHLMVCKQQLKYSYVIFMLTMKPLFNDDMFNLQMMVHTDLTWFSILLDPVPTVKLLQQDVLFPLVQPRPSTAWKLTLHWTKLKLTVSTYRIRAIIFIV